MTGKNRTVAGNKINTAETVHTAIETVNAQTLDLDAARNSLARLGNANADAATVERYARESAILSELQKLTGANVTGQIGKWNMASEATTLAAFDSYLNRRIAGQHARWTENKTR
jgi:hypothetical protein